MTGDLSMLEVPTFQVHARATSADSIIPRSL